MNEFKSHKYNTGDGHKSMSMNTSFHYNYSVVFNSTAITSIIINKRAQRALGRSPEEKVKGHSGANNREPQGHNLNNFGRGPLDDAIYQIWKLWAL